MDVDHKDNFDTEHQKVLDSIKLSRIIPPILLGLAVVLYIVWKQFDPEAFAKIQWGGHAIFWVLMAVSMYVLRHMFYAWRLRILSNEDFGWLKSIELIFIWEFASAVSPTSIGGSAVALFLLAQEKISAARTVSIVLYSVVVDTLFFVLSMPLLFLVLGPVIIRPDMQSLSDLDGYGLTFLLVLLVMALYGAVFFYGLFINPTHLKRFLLFISRWKILKRFKKSLRDTAYDVVVSSKELAGKSRNFHMKALLATSGAWVTRFLAVNCIIIALVETVPLDFWSQLTLYARSEVMYAVTAFSPTPGGSGVAEVLFGGFYSDFIPKSIAIFIALLWRLITYYPYLIIGVIIIPVWIRELLIRRKMEKGSL